MASTYVNDLRLNELGTGDASGTWGNVTNTNLELIGEGLSFTTKDCFASDGNQTETIADGATDPARGMYFKVTSSATLTATRILTIEPNTVSRLQYIENATTGSQTITIKQGSGSTVDIPSGQTKAVYLDGAGSGAKVVDAFATLNVGALTTGAITAGGNTSVTGNITVTGTVDGRDVATDGTKLDGIEASADVTDSTNVASALTGLATETSFINPTPPITGVGRIDFFLVSLYNETFPETTG